MHAVYLLNSAAVGGGNRSMLALWRGLHPLGVLPTAVIPDRGAMSAACQAEGVPWTLADFEQPAWRRPLRSGRAAFAWRHLLESSRAQLVHSNGLHAARSVAIAAWSLGLPHVCHVHFPAPEGYVRWVFRRLPKPDWFLYCSRALEAEMAGLLCEACPRAGHHTVHNGIDLSRFVRARERPAGPRPRIGMVANLLPVKGHADFLRMAAILRERGTDAEYWVIGGNTDGVAGDRYAERLGRLASELGLGSSTTFFGFRDDVPELLASLDIVVCPSRVEPFGISLVEAMASGKPVVATRVGGIPEVVDEGRTGLLVPPASPRELAEGVAGLVASPELRRSMGEAGRRRASRLFGVDAQAAAVKAIYDDLA